MRIHASGSLRRNSAQAGVPWTKALNRVRAASRPETKEFEVMNSFDQETGVFHCDDPA
jgi:hypothetical protein